MVLSSKKTKIVLTRSLVDNDKSYITNGLAKIVGDKFELVSPKSFDENGICEVVEDAEVLLGPYITENILNKAKNLKLIQIPWTGMDTCDFSAAKGRNIPICNTHSNAGAVAELGVTLLLNLIKKISYHDRKMRHGNWNRDKKPLDLTSILLSNSKVCILGCGNIGYRVAKILHAFGAKVIAVDERIKADEIVSEVFNVCAIKEAVNKSNIVISTLPLTPSTKNLINKALLDDLKEGLYWINMSRAGIFDEDALYEGLIENRIAGFASDVWWNAPKRGESESYPSTHNEFWKLDNVVMSPHRAGFIAGCLPHLDEAIENLANLILGKSLINIVDIEKQY